MGQIGNSNTVPDRPEPTSPWSKARSSPSTPQPNLPSARHSARFPAQRRDRSPPASAAGPQQQLHKPRYPSNGSSACRGGETTLTEKLLLYGGAVSAQPAANGSRASSSARSVVMPRRSAPCLRCASARRPRKRAPNVRAPRTAQARRTLPCARVLCEHPRHADLAASALAVVAAVVRVQRLWRRPARAEADDR